MEKTTENTTENSSEALESQTVVSQTTASQEVVAADAEQLIDIDHFMKVKLRVGQILEAEALPKSKKLLKLKVDLGTALGVRQVLAGISQFYSPEELINKRVIIVANLKPAKLMGLESQGMLLAASSEDDSMVKIVEPNPELPLGSVVR